jgi:very-short-patch-repair endonuclease
MVDQKHKPKWHASEEQRSNVRAVRREMTEAERIICCNAHAHRFQGVSRRQAPVGRDVVDFVCHAAKLTVEVGGGQHFEPKTPVRDARRDAYLAVQGCGIVGFNSLDVIKKAGVLEDIARVVGGSKTPSLTRRCSRGRGPGHAGREDVP